MLVERTCINEQFSLNVKVSHALVLCSCISSELLSSICLRADSLDCFSITLTLHDVTDIFLVWSAVESRTLLRPVLMRRLGSRHNRDGVVERGWGVWLPQVARAATEATLRTAVLGTRAGFSVARGCCAVTGRAVEGAVHSLPLPLPGRAHVSSLVHSTHRRVQRALCATEHCTLTGMKFSGAKPCGPALRLEARRARAPRHSAVTRSTVLFFWV